MKILLMGFAASGKSAAGKLLADKLHLSFYDVDCLIEQAAGKTVAQIFADFGEQYFRKLENNALKRLTDVDNAVVALGGGSVLCDDFAALTQNSTVVWLKVSASTVFARLADDTTRPLFDGLSEPALQKLMDARAPLYRSFTNFEVATDNKTPAEVAQEIAQKIAQ